MSDRSNYGHFENSLRAFTDNFSPFFLCKYFENSFLITKLLNL